MATMMQLISLNALMRMDILAWVIALPLLFGGILLLLYQRRQQRLLDGELEQLAKVKRHNIEYELVLKTMKLSTWRIDVPTHVVSFESDYRDNPDNVVFPADTKVEDVLKMLVEPYADKVGRDMADLMAGKIDDIHEQYLIRGGRGDKTYWGEGFATVDRRDIDGKPLTIVGTNIRIDRQKQIEAELIEARNHAEESDRLKTAFLANMSHEIRTPLNAIVGFSDVLPMAQSEEERQQLIGLIRQNNAHLLRLFDDMVNMSKLEAGGAETVSKTSFDLSGLFGEMAQKYADKSRETGVAIQTEMAAADMMVNTDRERLREILNQYMNNAMKFTAQGTVTMGYSLTDDGVRIWVRDTGKGIPKDKCDDRLFERFVKVDDFVPGTGLGLSICRSMANRLNGKVGVESEEGKGSCFWVEIPQA